MRTVFMKMVYPIAAAAVMVAILSASALGQDAETPRFEVGVGYANLTTYASGHHPGVAVDVSWNPRRWFGVQNYLGVYGLGNGVTLIAEIPGARIAARNIAGRVTPFAEAGFGFGLLTEHAGSIAPGPRMYSYHWSPAARYGVGTDVQINQSLAVRVDASRMTTHVKTWQTKWNISTGLVFRIF